MKPRIIVEISGGVVNCVYADQPISVEVLDHDNMKGGDMDEDELRRFQYLETETTQLKDYL